MRTKVNIGCGKTNFGKDWLHIDSRSFSHVDSSDVALEDFDDDTFDLIYASHFLEYADLEDAKYLLRCWWNKLKEGGTLRLAVPDFSTIAELYTSELFPLESFVGPLYGKLECDDTCNYYHRMVYDEKFLTSVLTECGYENVHRWDWRKTEHAHIDDCSQAYLPKMDKENGILISLNMEAVK